MNSQAAMERCFTFINCQISPSAAPVFPPVGFRAVTISRQAGSGGHAVAEALAEELQAKAPGQRCAWTIFDRNLVEKVLEDHQLPARLARFMKEESISEISDTMDELFGLHPSSWTLAHKAAETILKLAKLGNVILIGRGGVVITAKLPSVFHVRLVGSMEKRLQTIQEQRQLEVRPAREFLRQEDEGRRGYVKKYFDKNIEDPLLYHLVINTDLILPQEAGRLIADQMLRHMPAAATLAPVENS